MKTPSRFEPLPLLEVSAADIPALNAYAQDLAAKADAHGRRAQASAALIDERIGAAQDALSAVRHGLGDSPQGTASLSVPESTALALARGQAEATRQAAEQSRLRRIGRAVQPYLTGGYNVPAGIAAMPKGTRKRLAVTGDWLLYFFGSPS